MARVSFALQTTHFLRFAEGKPTLKDRLPLLGRTRHDALAEAFIRISGMHNELQALMRNPRRTS